MCELPAKWKPASGAIRACSRSLRDDYVLVALYTDDKTKVPENEWVTTAGGKVLKDIGRINSYIAQTRFG